MSEDKGGFIEVREAPQDGSWRAWSEDEFWLVCWLVETTASVTCVIPPDANTALWAEAQGLLDTIQAHQEVRDERRRLGSTMGTDAALIFSREQVTDRLEAMRADGLAVQFRPNGHISAMELSVRPGAR